MSPPTPSFAIPAGFRLACEYRVENGRLVEPVVRDDELWNAESVVYLRVCDGQVLYVGKCDGRLRQRMSRHFLALTGDASRAYRERVEGRTVQIFAYQPKPVRILGMKVSIHAGLESALIAEYEPPFVKRR